MSAVRLDEELIEWFKITVSVMQGWTVTISVQPAFRGSDEIGTELCQCWSDTQWRDT